MSDNPTGTASLGRPDRFTAPAAAVAPNRETAADRRAMPGINDIAESAAAKEGVCARVVPMRAFDPVAARTSYVGAPCKSTLESVCPACAKTARYVRMSQCKEGWCLAEEPEQEKSEPTQQHRELLDARARLFNDYHHARSDEDGELADAIAGLVGEIDRELKDLGVRGSFPPLNPKPRRKAKSTRRRDELPNLPRRKVGHATIGREYAGKYRPSTFLTLTLDSYGAVNKIVNDEGELVSDGSPRNPETYDYTRAARDIVHFKILFSKFIENLRRAVGWNVQYFVTMEPQRRGAPHLHLAIRGSIPNAVIKAVTEATYRSIWWPHHDREVYSGDKMPVWDYQHATFCDPDTGRPLTSWDEALAVMDTVDELAPAHVVRFGEQSKPIQILGGSDEEDRKVKYLTKYLTKSVSEILEPGSVRVAVHYDRLHEELKRTPCSKTCGVWLRYGIVPQGAKDKMVPGRCKGKAHRRETLGLPGQRCLNSDLWTGKSVADHKADRAEFVRQTLAAVGIVRPDTSNLKITPVRPGDKDAPPRAHLIMALVATRINQRAEYTMARLAIDEGLPGDGDGPREVVAPQQSSFVQQSAAA